MTRFAPERAALRLRSGIVAAVTAPTVSLSLDGQTIAAVPVYGPMPGISAKVLVLEQQGSLIVLGSAVSLLETVRDLQDRVDALEARMGGRNGDDQ
jgi:hypothetical protein